MTPTQTYLAKASGGLCIAVAIAALGFSVAGQTFASAAQEAKPDNEAQVSQADPALKAAQSPLLGSVPGDREQVSDASANLPSSARDKNWVQVRDAVNMRAGPSSGDPVIEVQLAGSMLQVVGRDAGWVQVVDPETGSKGWVYGTYVKRTQPTSRRADSGTTSFQ